MINRDQVSIRVAQPDEYSAVGAMAERAYRAGGHMDPGYGAVVRDAAARAAPGPLLVALYDDTIVGTVTLCPPGSPQAELCQPGEIEFRFLAVDPDRWSQGLAGILVDAVVDYARSTSAERLVCCVISWNDDAHRLYATRGFQRALHRDWSPVDDVDLWAYELSLS